MKKDKNSTPRPGATRALLGRLLAVLSLALVSSLVGLALALIGAWVARIIWPDDILIIDETVIQLAGLVAWPIASVVIAAMVIFSADLLPALAGLLRRFSGFKAGGYEVSFSAEGAERLKRDMEKELALYFDQAKAAYDREVRVQRVYDAVSDVLEAVRDASVALAMPGAQGIKPGHIRATVHVLDVGIEETLYQLTDYVPSGGGPRGRRYSIRYGAIGLTWRTGKPQAWNPNVGQTQQELVRLWGMTSDEAAWAMGRGFALCVPLYAQDKTIIGVFYMAADDLSRITTVAKDDQKAEIDKLLNAFQAGALKVACDRLSVKVAAVLDSVKDRGVFLDVHD